ncbi:11451_t:CDS:2, partial [Acaulospora morrowiae]
CPSTCTSCSIPNFSTNSTRDEVQCSTCTTGHVLDNGRCVKACSAGKFVSPTDQFTCIACDTTCATCNGPSASQCLSCSNPTQFSLNGVCSANPCPSSYVAINTTCIKCHPDCLECTGPGLNQCTKCPPNRPILTKEGQCVEVCPIGTFEDSTGKCQACDPSCSSCTGPKNSQCLGCTDKLKILTNGTCGAGCSSGTVMLISERLCYNLNDSLIPSDNFSGKNDNYSRRKLTWWEILLIVITVFLLLVLLILAIRFFAVRRRRVKTNDFRDQIDEIAVAKKMNDLMNSTNNSLTSSQSSDPFDHQKQLPRPEIPHLRNEFDLESSVAFNNNGSDRNQYQRGRTSYLGKDYLKWKVGKKFGDSLVEEASNNYSGNWDGFNAVLASGSRSSLKRSSSGVRRSGNVIMGRFGYTNQVRQSGMGNIRNPFGDNSSSIYSVNSIGNNSIGEK